jgi:hypothetical protein
MGRVLIVKEPTKITLKLDVYDARKTLPEKSGVYLAQATANGKWSAWMYSDKHKKFNTLDGLEEEFARCCAVEVNYWCEIPEVI